MDYIEPLGIDGAQEYEQRKTRFDVDLDTPQNYGPVINEISFGDTQTPPTKKQKDWCLWLWAVILLIGFFDRKK